MTKSKKDGKRRNDFSDECKTAPKTGKAVVSDPRMARCQMMMRGGMTDDRMQSVRAYYPLRTCGTVKVMKALSFK